MMRRAHWICTGLGLLAWQVPGIGQKIAEPSRSWFRVDALNGQPIGYGWRQVTRSGSDQVTTDSFEMRINERGNTTKRISDLTHRVENSNGQVVSITHSSQSGKDRAITSAAIHADYALIRRMVAKDIWEERVALPAGVRFDMGAGLLKSWDFSLKPKLEFDNFNLAASAVERIVMTPHSDVGTPTGGLILLRSSFGKDGLISVAKLTLNADRALIKTSRFQFGTITETRPMAAGIADPKKFPAYSVLQNAMVKAPYRILDPALEGHIRYIFAFKEGIVFTPPQTVNQRTRMVDDRAILDICASCGADVPLTAEARADALRPTAWLQSDHKFLMAIAAPIKNLKISDTKKMERLAVDARRVLSRMDFSGHYSALEALKRGAGDCTEDAVVLAALGRAAGIPTKVASGLAYSRERYHGVSNVFMPHNWTLAYADGRWQSFDMSLLGFDATHIALNIGDGDARSISAAHQLAGLLVWEKMSQIKIRTKAE